MAVDRKQRTLLGAVTGEGLVASDPAYDEPARDVLALAAGGERGERDFGDLGIGDPALLGFVEDPPTTVDQGSGVPLVVA